MDVPSVSVPPIPKIDPLAPFKKPMGIIKALMEKATKPKIKDIMGGALKQAGIKFDIPDSATDLGFVDDITSNINKSLNKLDKAKQRMQN